MALITIKCHDCKGSGKIWDHLKRKMLQCWSCGGTGKKIIIK